MLSTFIYCSMLHVMYGSVVILPIITIYIYVLSKAYNTTAPIVIWYHLKLIVSILSRRKLIFKYPKFDEVDNVSQRL